MQEHDREQRVRQVCRMFIHTDRLHRKTVERFADTLGIHRSQHFVLMRTAHMGGSVPQKTLAAALQISPAALAVTLKKLQSGGFIEKTPTEGDGRGNTVTLTDKGREIIRISEQKFSGIDERMMDGFSDGELATLLGFLERMQNNLKKDETGDLE